MEYMLKAGTITDYRRLPDVEQKHTTWGVNSYQVRVLPDMHDIWDKDPQTGDLMLPRYPNFFDMKDYAYQVGDMVWVACSHDFQVGYILGYMQPPQGTDIMSFLASMHVLESKAGYKQSSPGELTIDRLSKSCVTMTNVNTGTTYQSYHTNIFYLYGPDGSTYTCNGKYLTHIATDGSITIEGNSKKEKLSGDVYLSAKNKTEEVETNYLSSVGDTSINSGGAVNITAASSIKENATTNYSSLVGGSRTLTAGLTTVNSGISEIHNVATGVFAVNVAAGGITLTSSLPIALTSATAINFAAPIVNVTAGLFSLLACPVVQLPIGPIGFAILGGIGLVSPTCIGV